MEQKFSQLINAVKEGNNNNNLKNKIEKKSIFNENFNFKSISFFHKLNLRKQIFIFSNTNL